MAKKNEYGNFGKKELENARWILNQIKDAKMLAKAPEHVNDPLNFHDVRRHLQSEVSEFKDVAYTNHLDAQLKELGDISSCCDVLAMLILRKKAEPILPDLPPLFEKKQLEVKRE